MASKSDTLPIKVVKRSTGNRDRGAEVYLNSGNRLSAGMEKSASELSDSDLKAWNSDTYKDATGNKAIDSAMNSGVKAAFMKRRGKARK